MISNREMNLPLDGLPAHADTLAKALALANDYETQGDIWTPAWALAQFLAAHVKTGAYADLSALTANPTAQLNKTISGAAGRVNTLAKALKQLAKPDDTGAAMAALAAFAATKFKNGAGGRIDVYARLTEAPQAGPLRENDLLIIGPPGEARPAAFSPGADPQMTLADIRSALQPTSPDVVGMAAAVELLHHIVATLDSAAFRDVTIATTAPTSLAQGALYIRRQNNAITGAFLGNAQNKPVLVDLYRRDDNGVAQPIYKKPFTLTANMPTGSYVRPSAAKDYLREALVRGGWDGERIINATLTIPAGTIYGAASTAWPALFAPELPDGSTFTLVNNGWIVGRGGRGGGLANGNADGQDGGPALDASNASNYTLNLINNGTIGGGGGGGGALFLYANLPGRTGTTYARKPSSTRRYLHIDLYVAGAPGAGFVTATEDPNVARDNPQAIGSPALDEVTINRHPISSSLTRGGIGGFLGVNTRYRRNYYYIRAHSLDGGDLGEDGQNTLAGLIGIGASPTIPNYGNFYIAPGRHGNNDSQIRGRLGTSGKAGKAIIGAANIDSISGDGDILGDRVN